MDDRKFQELYKNLNKEQRLAVDTIEGPVMVIAGPGTGKTSILTLRIANILRKTDTSPDSILALTFTESGVTSMREKLVSIIGQDAYRVHIHTFHSFSNEIIQNHPTEFRRIIGSTHLAEVDQIRIIEEIILKNRFENLKPFSNPTYFLKEILNAIRGLKREDISPRNFKVLIEKQENNFKSIDDLCHVKGKYRGMMKGKYANEKKKIDSNKELNFIYEKYEKHLVRNHLYDFEDMVIEVVKALRENKNFALELQENHQYVLADEHQDTNTVQNELLQLISSFFDNPNLFIVGDEKQAVYRFQGASAENFHYFKEILKKGMTIQLKQNYRSTQEILDASNDLIDEYYPNESLVSQEKKKSPLPKVFSIEDPISQYESLVKSIKKNIVGKVKPEKIAVIYRNNREADEIGDELQKQGIEVSVHSNINILEDENIRNLLSLFRLVLDFTNDDIFAEVLLADFMGLKSIDVYKILAHTRKGKEKLIDIVSSKKILRGIGVTEVGNVIDLAEKLERWAKIANNKSLITSFEEIKNSSGYIDHISGSRDVFTSIERLRDLLATVESTGRSKKNSRLRDLVSIVEVMEGHGLVIHSSGAKHVEGKVNLMTAHRSKGLEYKIVYIVGATDDKWGSKRNRSPFLLPVGARVNTDIHDERRLFFVALTRAKDEVMIFVPKRNSEGKELLPSVFVQEINDKYLSRIELKSCNKLVVRKKKNGAKGIRDKKYLNSLFIENGLSVSALNNYLKCPWQYFFINLIRVPQTKEIHQIYGTAVHSVLKSFVDGKPKKDNSAIIGNFEAVIRKSELDTEEIESSLKKAKKSLPGFIRNIDTTISSITELRIGGVQIAKNISINGILDKVEMIDGGVRVVDYKTGKIKSRNEIEGKTKNSTGDMKRQLIFYKLLLNNFERGKYNMQSGRIDFVEPTDSGKYRSEEFEITDREVEELEELIKRTAKEILTLSFWDSECGDPKCKWCKLSQNIRTRE